MRTKILIAFLLLIALCFNSIAQKDNLPVDKYKNGNTFKDVFKDTRHDLKGFSFSLGYQHTQFLNSRYGLLSEDKLLKQPFGFVLSFRQPIYPVFIDVNLFDSFYKSETNITTKDAKLSFRGIDFSVSVALFPISSKVARFIVPYGGAGYQLAELIESKSYLTMISDSNIYSKAKVNQPFWKAGLMINPVRKLIINLEYRQAIPLNNEKAINQYFITIGYRFNRNR